MKLLVAVDLSDSTIKVLNFAEQLAKALSAKLWLLHVAEPEPDFVGYKAGPQSVRDSLSEKFHTEHHQIQKIADQLREEGLNTTALLVQGSTVEAILQEASDLDIDIIIVGSHGRGGMYELFVGSVSKGILLGSKCPVLVVPTRGG